MNIAQLIEMARRNTDSGKIAEVLEKLEVSSATLSLWRTGKTLPTDAHAARLAELAGLDPMETVVDVMEASAPDPQTRAVWARIKRAVNAAATTLPAALMAVHHCILCKIHHGTNSGQFVPLREYPAC